MFKISKQAFGTLDKYQVINALTNEYFSVVPGFGADVIKLILNKKNRLLNIIDGDSDYESLIENKMFKGAFLIPYPNRIKDGKYYFESQNYHLPVNLSLENNALHGLLYNKSFIVSDVQEGADKGSITMQYQYNDLVNGFPFPFITEVNLSLDKRGFRCNIKVKNSGNTKMPSGVGWHPYFTFGEPIDEIYLKIPESRKIIVDDRMIPTGDTQKDNSFDQLKKIGNMQFDAGFMLDDKEYEALTQLYSKNKNATINIWQENGLNKFKYLQVYIPPRRNSIAVEPMTCNTNAFNNNGGLIILEPGENYNASFGVYLS